MCEQGHQGCKGIKPDYLAAAGVPGMSPPHGCVFGGRSWAALSPSPIKSNFTRQVSLHTPDGIEEEKDASRKLIPE